MKIFLVIICAVATVPCARIGYFLLMIPVQKEQGVHQAIDSVLSKSLTNPRLEVALEDDAQNIDDESKQLFYGIIELKHGYHRLQYKNQLSRQHTPRKHTIHWFCERNSNAIRVGSLCFGLKKSQFFCAPGCVFFLLPP